MTTAVLNYKISFLTIILKTRVYADLGFLASKYCGVVFIEYSISFLKAAANLGFIWRVF
jgi:hypothetical protein